MASLVPHRAQTLSTKAFLSRRVLPSAPRTITKSSRHFYGATAPLVLSKEAEKATSTPFAALPLGVLLRSLLIASVLTKPFLLGPSLSILSFLSKPDRRFLLSADRNPLIHWVLKRTFYAHFCAGENKHEVHKLTASLKRMGLTGAMLIYAKETVFDHKSKTQIEFGAAETQDGAAQTCEVIETWKQGILETTQMLGEGDQIALKLTGAGPSVTKAFISGDLPPQQMIHALYEICSACQAQGSIVLIDAESQHFQRGIDRLALDLMRKFNNDGYAVVLNTYQAYLKATKQKISDHLQLAVNEGWALGAKLVRGAYMATDDRSLIHDTKKDTDNNYNTITQGLIKNDTNAFGLSALPEVNLLLATHNGDSAVAALELHQTRINDGLPTVPLKFAQLQGMCDDVSFKLLEMKDNKGRAPNVVKCTTWGSLGDCLGYLMRRAQENRDAVGRTQDQCAALWKELRRRIW